MEKTMQSSKASIQIGIEEQQRASIAQMLSLVLADEHVLYIKLRNYHWTVTGMFFQALHGLFEDQYDDIAEKIDDIAERIRSLGFFSAGSMEEFQQMARLKESGNRNGDGKQMIKDLLADHEAIIQILRHDINNLEIDYNDAGTTDFLTGLMQMHEKMAWMLRSHLA